MYYVYVLYSAGDEKFYIGYTSDIKRRVCEHKAGCNHTTSRYKNCELILSENFINKDDACRREKYLKTSKGRKTLRLMLRETLSVI